MNYFEMLEIEPSVTGEDAITAAYQRARIKWQTLLAQGIGEQQKVARQLMGGQLEDAYETLVDETKRQQYLRQLKLSQEMGIPMGDGRVQVSFALDEGYQDYDFLVVENPVRVPLETADGTTVSSLQEYVCRVWENPQMGANHISDRSLERWIYYSAAEESISNALNYMRWDPEPLEETSQLAVAVDLLQSRYPAPILPLNTTVEIAERLAAYKRPAVRISPQIANFGLLASGAPTSMPIQIKAWQQDVGELKASCPHPAVSLDIKKLGQGELTIIVDAQKLERGETLATEIKVVSSLCEIQPIPLFAARPNRMLGNSELARSVNYAAGKAAMKSGAYQAAIRYFRMAHAHDKEAEAVRELVEVRHSQGDWPGAIRLARYHNERFPTDARVQRCLVEALFMVGGSIYQIGDKRRSLEHLATLACEFSQLSSQRLPNDSWVMQPDAQLHLDPSNPKMDWVDMTETFGLNWTHAGGRADRSYYAGEVPQDLSARRVQWRTAQRVNLVPPLVAYEGVLAAQAANQMGIVALDAASGEIAWNFDYSVKGKGAHPVAGNGRLYVADASGKVSALDIASGEEKWSTQLEDGKDLSMVYENSILYVGTARRLVLLAAENGEFLVATDEMKAVLGATGANPVNLMASDNCCLFQKVGGTNPSMVFLDIETGVYLEFPMPVNRSMASSLFGTLFAGSSWSEVTWASFAGEIYVPFLITQEWEARTRYQDSDGKSKEKVHRDQWQEVHFYVYGARSNKILANTQFGVSGTLPPDDIKSKTKVVEVRAANAVAVTPAYVEITEGANICYPPLEGKPLHRIIAVGFDRDVYYWTCTDKILKQIGWRDAGGNVQSIAFAGLYDIVTTSDTLSTSFMGNTEEGNATAYVLKPAVNNVVGSPAFYGDMIYLLTNSGEVVAVGR